MRIEVDTEAGLLSSACCLWSCLLCFVPRLSLEIDLAGHPRASGQHLLSLGRSQDSESRPSRRMSQSRGKGRSLSGRLMQNLHRSTTGSGSGLAEMQPISHYPHRLSHELRPSNRSATFNLRSECIYAGSFLQSLHRPSRKAQLISGPQVSYRASGTPVRSRMPCSRPSPLGRAAGQLGDISPEGLGSKLESLSHGQIRGKGRG